MAPSEDSQLLANLYKQISQAFPRDGNVVGSRFVYENIQQASTEASGVTFEETTVVSRPCLWIRPSGASDEHVILFMHGGGFTSGSPQSHRKMAAHLAKACNCIALSIDYRLAPEHRFPAAIDDGVDAYKFLLDSGYKADHIVTAGDSCGGHLATSVLLCARDKGLPMPACAVAISPWYDLTHEGPTMKSNADVNMLGTADTLRGMAHNFIEGTGAKLNDPLVSPLFADLTGLPPHWLSVAGYDMLKSGGDDMAAKMKKEGIEVVYEVHEGMQHVFELMAGKAPEADRSIRMIGEWVRKKIGS
ncbi:hypothetical protein MBLNU457_3711t1 [Dothideomycetes sp. NU457]